MGASGKELAESHSEPRMHRRRLQSVPGGAAEAAKSVAG